MMKRTVVLAILSVGALVAGMFLGSASRASAGDMARVERFGVDVALARSASQANAYECVVTVTDLDSGEPVARPTITALYGDEARVVSGTAAGDSLHASIKVDKDGMTAAYTVQMLRDGKAVASHSGTIQAKH